MMLSHKGLMMELIRKQLIIVLVLCLGRQIVPMEIEEVSGAPDSSIDQTHHRLSHHLPERIRQHNATHRDLEIMHPGSSTEQTNQQEISPKKLPDDSILELQLSKQRLSENFYKALGTMRLYAQEISDISAQKRAKFDDRVTSLVDMMSPEDFSDIAKMSPDALRKFYELMAQLCYDVVPMNIITQDVHLSPEQKTYLAELYQQNLLHDRNALKDFIYQSISGSYVSGISPESTWNNNHSSDQHGYRQESFNDQDFLHDDNSWVDHEDLVHRSLGLGDEASIPDLAEPAALSDTVAAVVDQNQEIIDLVEQWGPNIQDTLEDIHATQEQKSHAQKEAAALQELTESGQKILEHVSATYNPELKRSGWYETVVNQKNILTTLSFGLKAASVGIAAYGFYRYLIHGSAARGGHDQPSAPTSMAP